MQIPAPLATRAAPVSPVAVMWSRTVLFAVFQAVVAAGFAMAGATSPWDASVAWWPVTVVGANLVSVGLLARGTADAGGLARLYLPPGGRVGRDLPLLLGVLALAGPLGHAPNVLLATWLWGDATAPLALFVQPLPAWARMVALVGFPLTIALSELPTYYGYVLPRLERAWGRPRALVGVALAHALQHVALPLVFDGRFLVWRSLMFVPFALLVGAAVQRRPTLLPYLMVVHGLIDASVGWLVYSAT